jgi:hypothetical protein
MVDQRRKDRFEAANVDRRRKKIGAKIFQISTTDFNDRFQQPISSRHLKRHYYRSMQSCLIHEKKSVRLGCFLVKARLEEYNLLFFALKACEER